MVKLATLAILLFSITLASTHVHFGHDSGHHSVQPLAHIKLLIPKFSFKPKVVKPKFSLIPKFSFKPKVVKPKFSLIPKIGKAAKLGLVGLKVVGATTLALPMTVGAAIGAPVGAVVGAKIGAMKGALVGKAILIKKAALMYKGKKLLVKAIKKPFVLVKKAKNSVVSKFKAPALPKIPSFSILPALSVLPAVSAPLKLPLTIPLPMVVSKGPKSLEAKVKVVHPWVGKKYAGIELMSSS